MKKGFKEKLIEDLHKTNEHFKHDESKKQKEVRNAQQCRSCPLYEDDYYFQ